MTSDGLSLDRSLSGLTLAGRAMRDERCRSDERCTSIKGPRIVPSLGLAVELLVEKRGNSGAIVVRMFHGDDQLFSKLLLLDVASAEEAAKKQLWRDCLAEQPTSMLENAIDVAQKNRSG